MPIATTMPLSRSNSRPCIRLTALVAWLAGAAMIGLSPGQAEEVPGAGATYLGTEGGLPGSLQVVEKRNVVVAPGSPAVIPIVVSSQETGGSSVSTTLYISNHSDAEVIATVHFRGDDGMDLEMPIPTADAAVGSAAIDLQSTRQVTIGANATDRVHIRAGMPAKTGWVEISTPRAATLSVSARTVRMLAGSSQDFNEVPSTPAYRRAWLVVDNTDGSSTELFLVSPGADEAQSVHLEFQAGDSSCESTVEVPANGRATVMISDALACSTGELGTVEINSNGPISGIAKVSAADQDDTSLRSLTGLPSIDPVALEVWSVTDGMVQFEHLSSADCIPLDARMLVGVSYTVHSSTWQWRPDENTAWAELAATGRTGELCAYSPSEPGEYRGVAEITVDGVPGLYASSNSIMVAMPTAPIAGGLAPVPSFVVGETSVQFGPLTGECVMPSGTVQIDAVTYQIHSSKWQTRASSSGQWVDVEGTAQSGKICAYSPTEPGQYRAVVEVSRNGVRGTYASSNVLTEDPPAPPPGPAGTPGEEECSDLVGCFIPLPAGSFRMGSTSADADSDESPVTHVTISEGVQLAKYELTHAQWELIMGRAAAYVESDCEETCPIVAVAFLGISDIKVPLFLDLLNQRDTEFTYRLPTEAEWEYAARAGTTGDRYGSVDAVAWHSGNSGTEVNPIGQKQPNAWGFYDMLGNAYEWVEDFYGEYPGGSVTDPTGPETGSHRIARGGSFLRAPADARAPNRQRYSAGQLAPHIGIRLARERR